MRRQTYGYLPSRKASSPPIGRYQIILIGDRGTCVLTTCPRLHSTAGRPGFELESYRSQVQRLKHSATSHTYLLGKIEFNWIWFHFFITLQKENVRKFNLALVYLKHGAQLQLYDPTSVHFDATFRQCDSNAGLWLMRSFRDDVIVFRHRTVLKITDEQSCRRALLRKLSVHCRLHVQYSK